MISVIKIGGSLFELPDLAERLAELLSNVDGHKIIIPGGGKLTDVIRHWDHTHNLGEEVSHQLALQTLSINAHLLTSFSDSYQLTNSLEQVVLHQIWNANKTPVLDPCCVTLNDPSLPQHWDNTSDSISAWVTHQLPNARLILAKSVDLPDVITNFEELASQGLVDGCFSNYAKAIEQIEWCNLRSKPIQLTSMH